MKRAAHDRTTFMIEHRPYATLGGADHGWLRARHHFSFAGYHDEARMGWGALRVLNDDEIAPGRGFGMHPHRDMEIVTYVRDGAITHADSLGNSGRTAAGDVQAMSAGTGVAHSEMNLEAETTRLFQLWLFPRRTGIAPRWAQRVFPREAGQGFVPLASGFAADADALPIEADARVLGAGLAAGAIASLPLAAGRRAYLVVARGTVVLRGAGGFELTLAARDAAAIVDEPEIVATAAGAATELLLVETA